MATSKIMNTPFIVEQGTSGIWTYKKWSDGTAECWGRDGRTVAANSTTNNVYIDYPFTFVAIPYSLVTPAAGGSNSYNARELSDGSDATRLRLFYSNTYSQSAFINANIYVVGRWE